MAGLKINDMVPGAAGPSLVGASFVNFLIYQNYPLLRWEVGLVGLAIIAASGVAWLIYLAVPRMIRAVMEAALVIFFISANVDLIPSDTIAVFVLAALIFFTRISILRKLAVFGLVVFVTSLAGLGGYRPLVQEQVYSQGVKANDLPPILHIILDEHIGTGGLRAQGPDSQKLAHEITQAYSKRGFTIYSKAYSQYFHTTDAIPNELGTVDPSKFVASPEIPRTKWLDGMASMGYALKIYQSDFIDFCRNARAVSCITYAASTLESSLAYPMSVWERVQLVAWRFGMLVPGPSNAVKLINRGRDYIYSETSRGLSVLEPQDVTVGMGAMIGLERLSRDIGRARAGEVFFAHLLLPHFPFIFDASCRVLPINNWTRQTSNVPISSRQLAYNNQVRCALDKVMRVVDDLSVRTGGRFIAVIHGDHGSRILSAMPTQENQGHMTDADLISGYSTLFAIKPLGGTVLNPVQARPVAELLQEFQRSGFKHLPADGGQSRAKLWLPDFNRRPFKEAEMTSKW